MGGIWDGIVQLGSWIMQPLYFVVSWLLIGFHELFSPIFGADSGWAWALSIVGLTVVIRILLIPLFVKQIRASRNMQLLQPKVRELQKKYGHDRERLGQETMKLYRESGTNPFASCLPILLQAPIFLALFRVLDGAARYDVARGGVLSDAQVESLTQSTIFGARIADTFLGDSPWSVKVVTAVLVVLMTATTFTTQRQLMRKNMPEAALTGPYAQQQKMLLYVLPLVFAVSGVYFPVGVLLYWFTTNLWTMGQQFYVIRRNPAPGTPAFAARERRRAEKAAGRPPAGNQPADSQQAGDRAGGASGDGKSADSPPPPRPPSRNQPKKASRSKRRGASARPPRPAK